MPAEQAGARPPAGARSSQPGDARSPCRTAAWPRTGTSASKEEIIVPTETPDTVAVATQRRPASAAPAGRPRRLGLALAVIATAQLMVALDLTIVTAALPHIQAACSSSSPCSSRTCGGTARRPASPTCRRQDLSGADPMSEPAGDATSPSRARGPGTGQRRVPGPGLSERWGGPGRHSRRRYRRRRGDAARCAPGADPIGAATAERHPGPVRRGDHSSGGPRGDLWAARRGRRRAGVLPTRPLAERRPDLDDAATRQAGPGPGGGA